MARQILRPGLLLAHQQLYHPAAFGRPIPGSQEYGTPISEVEGGALHVEQIIHFAQRQPVVIVSGPQLLDRALPVIRVEQSVSIVIPS